MQVIIREVSTVGSDKAKQYTVGQTGKLLKHDDVGDGWYYGARVQFDDRMCYYHRVKLAEVKDA